MAGFFKMIWKGWSARSRAFSGLPRWLRYTVNVFAFAISIYLVFDITDWTEASAVPDQMDRLEMMQSAFYRGDFETLKNKTPGSPEGLHARLLEGDLSAHRRVSLRMLDGKLGEPSRMERQFIYLAVADRQARWGRPEKALHTLAKVSGGFADSLDGQFEKAAAVLDTLHPEMQAWGWSIASEAHLLRMETKLAVASSQKALALMEGDSAARLPELHYTMRHRYLRALADGYVPGFAELENDPQLKLDEGMAPIRLLERLAHMTPSRIAPVERAFISTLYDRFLDAGDFDDAHYFHGLIAVRRAEAELRTGNAQFAFQFARDGLAWAKEYDDQPSTIRLDLEYLSMQAAQARGDVEKVKAVAATLFDLGKQAAGNLSGASLLANVRGLDAQNRAATRSDIVPIVDAYVRDELAGLADDAEPWEVRVFDLMGRIYTNNGKAADAITIFERTKAIRDARGMDFTDEDLSAMLWHSDALLIAQRLNDAYETLLPLARIAQQNLQSLASFGGDGSLLDPFASRRQTFVKKHYALIFERLVFYMSTVPEAELSDNFKESSFTALQHAQSARVQQSVSRLALRKRAPNDETARLIRERQDVENELERLQIELERLRLFEDRPEDDSDIRSLERRIKSAQQDAANLGNSLITGAGDFSLQVSTAPLSIADIQQSLEPGQVLLTYMNSAELNMVFGWAITRDRFRFTQLPMRLDVLSETVTKLRSSLGSNAVLRGADLLDDARNSASGGFDTRAAHDLYAALVAPFSDVISEGDTLMVQADGPVASLPYALLLTAPTEPSRDAATLRAMPWLVKSHPTVTLPSLNYLQIAVEQRATGGSMDGRFIGFGNPKLDGASGEVVEGPGFEDGLAIPDAVKRLEPLPNTERELQAMAATLGFERSTITTGSRASEYTVRNTDFSGASVVTFATHGLLSGEISGLPEPALVFTPPWIWSTRTDDGLLLMSELRQMKLDAQWVIFSACNTAGGGGDGQEGLSGLASAALYAGAERLLVSHWAVRDDATADLTTAMMQILIDEPTLAGSAALQRAMLLLMTEKDSYASPDAWAAFVVVGGR